jgi:hypothetical protein
MTSNNQDHTPYGWVRMASLLPLTLYIITSPVEMLMFMMLVTLYHLITMIPKRAVATIYNALPPNVKRLETLMSFKTSLAKYLLDKCFYAIYPDSYTINNDKPTYL